MPTGKTYVKSIGRWVKIAREKAFDYDAEKNKDSVAFLISFYRAYPDYFADIFRSPNAKHKLELPQRFMMRVFARYRTVYGTGVRGLTKTYVILLVKMIEGILYPGETMRYSAPNQKQAAALAARTFHEIERDYPLLAEMWKVRNDRQDMFRITTELGSEFTMYSVRGDSCYQVIGEECGQEGENAFPIDDFIQNIMPTAREVRKVNQVIDPTHINEKRSYIGNACSRQNKAFTKLRAKALKDMTTGNSGYAFDISWEIALICNLRDKPYFEDLKHTLSPEQWLRECCARYTGTGDNPMLTEEVLSKSRKLLVMEDTHCGDENAIYIVAHDVSYVDSRKNAKCADVVLKLTRFKALNKRDRYLKQVVYVDNYPPQTTYYEQAMRVKRLWRRYTLEGGQTTYIIVDANSNGDAVVEELIKPAADGINLCCVNHEFHRDIESEGALPIIYPVKAGTAGTKDADGAMIEYAQSEFEHGNVELLTSATLDGVEQYKKNHGIKDISADRKIVLPYKNTDLLCQQIGNLQTKVSGISRKEVRKSQAIQRDIWSALKYALRFAQILEQKLSRETNAPKNSWESEVAKFQSQKSRYVGGSPVYDPQAILRSIGRKR